MEETSNLNGLHTKIVRISMIGLFKCTGWVKKSKLLILSEYVNKTEKI